MIARRCSRSPRHGQKLECNGDDGWELADPTHISLKGKACDDYKFSKNAAGPSRAAC